MTRTGYTLAILASAVMASACADNANTDDTNTPSGSTTGGEDTTFDHENDYISPWELVERLTKEGPPRYTSHVHSCSKIRYRTLGNVLQSLGVNIANATALSAGDLYKNGVSAMGSANYANRIRENIGITTSGASREFDIFAAAADEIQTAFTNNTIARCPGATLFDGANKCVKSGISCLIGGPASDRYEEYCNITVSTASTVTVGKRLAVAAMLAAAYTCE